MREDEIRSIAYQIWQEEGCPDGRDVDHWLMAETIWKERNEPTRTRRRARVSSAKTTVRKKQQRRRARSTGQ